MEGLERDGKARFGDKTLVGCRVPGRQAASKRGNLRTTLSW
mgnify:CR=1 FL=1